MSEKGQWIKGSRSDKFMSSLIVDDAILDSGRYIIMVSPVWNEESNQSPDHKHIFVEVLSTEKFSFRCLDSEYGLNVLSNSLKGVALDLPEE